MFAMRRSRLVTMLMKFQDVLRHTYDMDTKDFYGRCSNISVRHITYIRIIVNIYRLRD